MYPIDAERWCIIMVIDVFGYHTSNVEKSAKPEASLFHGQLWVREGVHQISDPVYVEIHANIWHILWSPVLQPSYSGQKERCRSFCGYFNQPI